MSKTLDLDDKDNDDDSDTRVVKDKLPSMVIIGLKTERGIIKIYY